jgi:zinc transport system ATP-binding protein
MHVNHEKNIIEVRDLAFSYNGEKVLEDITLDIHQGDYLGIIGPNGSGKSTLVKLILGLLKPKKGEILLFGEPISQFKAWSKIGYVPQKIHVDPLFPATVWEVVSMGRFAGKSFWQTLNKQDKTHIRKALNEVGIADLKDRQVGSLSGGQLQRVFIARALVTEPEVIFLDEPTVGVDMETQKQFYDLLRKLNQELDLTLVMVSHDLETIANETTEVACINKTKCYEKSPREMTKHQMIQAMYGDHKFFIGHQH